MVDIDLNIDADIILFVFRIKSNYAVYRCENFAIVDPEIGHGTLCRLEGMTRGILSILLVVAKDGYFINSVNSNELC